MTANAIVMANALEAGPPTVVLDDDPTGTQLMRDVPVLLDWSPDEIAAALRGSPVVHLMTNTRALDPAAARALTASAATAARQAGPGCRIVLRGDSTLRGHVLEEYQAVRSVAFGGRDPILLLLPALPTAGRVTRAGVHYVLREGRAVPVHETEYATDGLFGYATSRLLEYAEHRTGGLLAAARGREVHRSRLVRDGAGAVTAALLDAAGSGGPAAVCVDAETVADLDAARDGLFAAELAGAPVIVRCGPAFAAVLAGRLAPGLVDPPAAPSGVLVVCGSYVPASTRQLIRLRQRTGVRIVEVDARALASAAPAAEMARAAGAAGAALAAAGVAVLSTPRTRPADLMDLASGERIAANLARTAAAVRPAPSVLVGKGGITSAVLVRVGLDARAARVVGPLAPGVSLWQAGPGRPDVVVFPGNVGDDDALADVVVKLTSMTALPSPDHDLRR